MIFNVMLNGISQKFSAYQYELDRALILYQLNDYFFPAYLANVLEVTCEVRQSRNTGAG